MNFHPMTRNPAIRGAWGWRVTSVALVSMVVLVLGIVPSRVFAQMNTGTIFGTVTDASGATVPSATITITNLGTGISQTLETDNAGSYVVPTLIPGTYEVAAVRAGFQTMIRTGITLEIDQKARVDLTLQVGAITQRVEVSGQAALVQTASSEQSQVITSQEMVGLPLNLRNFAELVSLNAGSVPNHSTVGGNINPDNPQGFSDTNVNGITADGNNWQIDGITDNEAFFSIISVNPSIDAIQEFKATTNDYAAEFGRAGGANVQISIKSGANSLHGGVFEFLRNSKLDASDFFSNEAGLKIPPFKQNQFGGNLGGPIKKNRTFFFGDYEGYRSRTGQTAILTIPDLLQRQGIFTEAGSPVIYNPYDIDPATSHPVAFTNNTIPSTSITSPAAKVMALLPTPNLTVPVGQGNFAGSNSVAHNVDNFDVRVDHRMTDHDQFFTRYSYLGTTLANPPFLGPQLGGSILANTRNQNGVISEIHMFSPRTINEFRFGINRVRTDWTDYNAHMKTSDEVGIPGLNSYCGFCGGLTNITISGMSSLGHAAFAPTYRHDTIFQWVDNVTFVRGRHTIKTGADIRRIRANLFQATYPVGEFDFDGRFTSDLGAPGTGLGPASFLLGNYESAERGILYTYPSSRASQFFFFGQDDFKVNEKLTLNLGLRYEYYAPATDAHNNIANFDLATGDMLIGCIATSCSGGVKPDRRDWAPRVGFAYSPGGGKTAIRSGAGISYFSPGYGGQMGNLNTGFPYMQSQQLTPANSLTISPTDPVLSEGLPAIAPAEKRPGAPAGHLIPTGNMMYYQDMSLKLTRVYQWSLDIQRSVTPNFLVDAAYVGNSVIHYFVGLGANYPEPGVATATGLSLQEARPYYSVDPNLQGFTKWLNAGHSTYHAFQLKMERRFSSGLSFLVSYTLSKDLVMGGNPDPDHWTKGKTPQYFDTPQRLVFSYLYQLPFGQNRHWGKGWNRVTDSFLGGWQASGITSYMAGFPFGVGIQSTLDNGNGNTPLRICSGRASNPTIYRWFDPGCFVSPPRNVYGSMGGNILRGPGFRDWDVGVLKNFTFTESRYLQFRAEFFNLPNNVNFGLPNSYVCGGACGEGTITSLATGSIPRQIQFALKFYF
jgi:hypothetical protein